MYWHLALAASKQKPSSIFEHHATKYRVSYAGNWQFILLRWQTWPTSHRVQRVPARLKILMAVASDGVSVGKFSEAVSICHRHDKKKELIIKKYLFLKKKC